jgi:hypothetical protein
VFTSLENAMAPPHNHFFHLKNIYGPIAAHSMAISAAG